MGKRNTHIDNTISDDDVFEHVITGVRLNRLLALIRDFADVRERPLLFVEPTADKTAIPAVS